MNCYFNLVSINNSQSDENTFFSTFSNSFYISFLKKKIQLFSKWMQSSAQFNRFGRLFIFIRKRSGLRTDSCRTSEKMFCSIKKTFLFGRYELIHITNTYRVRCGLMHQTRITPISKPQSGSLTVKSPLKKLCKNLIHTYKVSHVFPNVKQGLQISNLTLIWK